MRKQMMLLFLFSGNFFLAQAQQDSTLQAFAGKYTFPAGSVVSEVTVSLDNGVLSMVSSAGTSALEKIGEDLYSIIQFQGTALFRRDANKKVIGVSIKAMGHELEGTKSEGAPGAANYNKYRLNETARLLSASTRTSSGIQYTFL